MTTLSADAGIALKAFMLAASDCANEMMSNASYIEKELPKITLPAELKGEILAVCDSLVGTKHDVISEVLELGELPDDTECDVLLRRAERILRWLCEEPPKLHSVVSTLDRLNQVVGTASGSAGLAYLLVAESATNILHGVAKASDAADKFYQVMQSNKPI